MRSIWIGWDPREADAFDVCQRSIRMTGCHEQLSSINLDDMRSRGLYWRKTFRYLNGAGLYDAISGAAMSTEFAISRFLTPVLADRGWALFMDCDMLVRRNLDELFALADPRYAVQVVKHPELIGEGIKMDGQPQVRYRRKNWSSVMLFNVAHPSNKKISAMINSSPGRDLHAFGWLEDHEIGELPAEWNYLVGVSPHNPNPAIAHFTLGVPTMRGYERCQFADEWRAVLEA